MSRSSWIAGFLVLLSLLAMTGCYTVLRHPTAESVVHEDGYYKTCADCHADASFYHPYYTYGLSHYRWRDYYGYPWWYDDYWWWDPYDDGDDGDAPEVKRGTGHLWGSGGWPSGGWGLRSPSSGDAESPPTNPPPVRRPFRMRPKERVKPKEEPPKQPDQEKTKEPPKEEKKPTEPKGDRPAPRPVRPTPRRGG
jgi:hypothetical protein